MPELSTDEKEVLAIVIFLCNRLDVLNERIEKSIEEYEARKDNE